MATELISLGILSLCAIIGGFIASKFKQPAVFGLLLVGAIIGPNALNLVQDTNMVKLMAEFGAILILFIVGLEFDLSKLMKIGARSLLIGLLKFAIVLFFGYETTLLLGFSSKAALFVGVILSFSSTVVVVKVLEQKHMFSRREVPLLIAVLIIEDILAVLALTFFSGVKNSGLSLFETFEKIIFSIAILLLAYYFLMKVLKYFVNFFQRADDDSFLTFLSLGLGASFSYFAFYLGLAPSAGAFLAGSLVASLPNSKEYHHAIMPYALIFTSIFFISMGTLVNFSVIESNLPLIVVSIVTIFISRFIAIGFLTFLLANFRDEQPFFSSIVMISVGEFSLLVAKESEKFGLGIDLVTITAAIIFITALLMAIGINYSENLHSKLNSAIPIRAKIKLERLSNYMRKFFDQLEIESTSTKKLMADSKLAFILVILAIFTSFILRRASIFIKQNYHPFALYAFYVASASLFVYLLRLIYRRVKSINLTLSVILTYVDNSRNIKKCSAIISTLLIALLLFFLAMFFPFAMFAFNLNTWTNIIPLVFLIVAFYYIKRLVGLVDNDSSYAPRGIVGVSFAKF